MTLLLQFMSEGRAIAPAFANHLWQSTLFAGVAAVLALALRKNSARVRYGLWLAASLKFLLPFSLLMEVGRRISWLHPAELPSAGAYVIEMVGQPFSPQSPLPAGIAQPTTAGAGGPISLLPWVLGLWLCGLLAVLSVWIVRWLHISRAIRRSAQVTEGREFSTLRRVEGLAGITRRIKMLISRTSVEPGVFGIARPVLLWPGSISGHLDDAQLEAVIAHELCHVKRRDNLWAGLHMLVEAIFWFYPPVWWIGARLLEERERACDEAVVELGSRRHVYAESILKVCEFCLTSPLTCVSGVTGSDLKKRMVHIMNGSTGSKLDRARKLLLGAVACLAIALPVGYGVWDATPTHAEASVNSIPKFSNVSVKVHPKTSDGSVMTKMMMVMVPMKADETPGIDVTGTSLRFLIQNAYRIQETQLSGGPEWINTERYDIQASIDPSVVEQMRTMSEPQRDLVSQLMFQQLLADYFKVAVHQESVDLPVYELAISDSGSKLQKSSSIGMIKMNMGELDAKGTPLSILTNQLSQRLGRTVIDKTGLTGDYVFTLRWTPDSEEMNRLRASGLPAKMIDQPTSPSSSAPPLATALQEQLGLVLRPMTTRVPVLVVDHAEQPAQ